MPNFDSPLSTVWFAHYQKLETVFHWRSVCSMMFHSFHLWPSLSSESGDNVRSTTHTPNALAAYFLMRGRTQSVCGVKSMTCHSSSISCAVHSRPVLLTQNKDGSVSVFVKLRTAHRSDSRTLRWKENSPRNVIF